MKNKIQTTLLLSASCFLFAACGKGFATDSTANLTSSALESPSESEIPTTPNTELSKLSYQGKQSAGTGDGQLVLELDVVRDAVVIVLPIPAAILGPITSVLAPNQEFPIRELPGAKVFEKSGKVAVLIPLKYIVRNGSFKNPQFLAQLPNGDELPGFPDGEGAGFGIEIAGKRKVHIYVGTSAAAAFIETAHWDEFLNCNDDIIQCLALRTFSGPFPIKNAAATEILGYVSFIPAKAQFHSGVYASAMFNESLARFINTHIRY